MRSGSCGGRSGSGREPAYHEPAVLNNNEYNVVSLLSEKSKGLQLYDTYVQDAQAQGLDECVQLVQQFKQQDEQAVEQLRQHVQMLVQQGQF